MNYILLGETSFFYQQNKYVVWLLLKNYYKRLLKEQGHGSFCFKCLINCSVFMTKLIDDDDPSSVHLIFPVVGASVNQRCKINQRPASISRYVSKRYFIPNLSLIIKHLGVNRQIHELLKRSHLIRTCAFQSSNWDYTSLETYLLSLLGWCPIESGCFVGSLNLLMELSAPGNW